MKLKINQLEEGKVYQREAGGFVSIRNGEFLFAEDSDLDFTPTESLSLSDKFKLSDIVPVETLRDLFIKFTEDNRAAAKDRNRDKLFLKIVEEVEAIKEKLKK